MNTMKLQSSTSSIPERSSFTFRCIITTTIYWSTTFVELSHLRPKLRKIMSNSWQQVSFHHSVWFYTGFTVYKIQLTETVPKDSSTTFTGLIAFFYIWTETHLLNALNLQRTAFVCSMKTTFKSCRTQIKPLKLQNTKRKSYHLMHRT